MTYSTVFRIEIDDFQQVTRMRDYLPPQDDNSCFLTFRKSANTGNEMILAWLGGLSGGVHKA